MDEREKRRLEDRILHSPSYRLAYEDVEFLSSATMRAARMELEFLKPETTLNEQHIVSTIVVFGSTRIVEPAVAKAAASLAKSRLADTPDDPRRQRAAARAERLAQLSRYYDVAREFAKIVSEQNQNAQTDGTREFVIVTGGGPGIMEAANRGAFDVGAKSIGLNIHLPMEQKPNPYIAPELCFQFRYFALRKFHFLLRAKALIVFPGGFGTLDELFDALTLRQTGRMQDIPIILFGREYWENVFNFGYLAEQGTIEEQDLDLFRYAETAPQAWEMIQRFHRRYGGEESPVDY